MEQCLSAASSVLQGECAEWFHCWAGLGWARLGLDQVGLDWVEPGWVDISDGKKH